MLPRQLSQFEGESIILGCGNRSNTCKKSHPYQFFYTIDIGQKINPDFVHDITRELPSNFNQRFRLTVLEALPQYVYDPDFNVDLFANDDDYDRARKGFENMFSMTKDDGFILILGCEATQLGRRFLKNYNYFHLKSTYSNLYHVVLLPKNQALSSKEAHEQILTLNPSSLDYIKNVSNYNPGDTQLGFFDKFDDLPSKGFCLAIPDVDLEPYQDGVRIKPGSSTYQKIYNKHPALVPLLPPTKEDENKNWNKMVYIGAAGLVLGIGFFAYSRYCEINPPAAIIKCPTKCF